MAKYVIKTPVITVNAVDLSNRADSVTIETAFDEVESTAFGDSFKQYEQGMGDATITVEWQQDFAAAEIDATLWPLASAGTTFPVTVKPTSAAVSATNPLYSMTCRLFGYSPMDGGIGDLSKTTTAMRNASSTGLTRATS